MKCTRRCPNDSNVLCVYRAPVSVDGSAIQTLVRIIIFDARSRMGYSERRPGGSTARGRSRRPPRSGCGGCRGAPAGSRSGSAAATTAAGEVSDRSKRRELARACRCGHSAKTLNGWPDFWTNRWRSSHSRVSQRGVRAPAWCSPTWRGRCASGGRAARPGPVFVIQPPKKECYPRNIIHRHNVSYNSNYFLDPDNSFLGVTIARRGRHQLDRDLAVHRHIGPADQACGRGPWTRSDAALGCSAWREDH